MLDIRATAYISPVAEMDFASVPLTVHLSNVADETGLVTGKFRVYNSSTGTLIHTTDILPVSLAAGQSIDASGLTDFDPPAPLDDTYFVIFDGNASNALVPDGIGIHFPSFYFDVKPIGMGPAPAAHAATHEDAGSDPLDHGTLPGLADDDHQQYQLRSELGAAGGYCGLPDPLDTTLPLRADGTPALPTGIVYESDVLSDSTAGNFLPWDRKTIAATPALQASEPNHPGIVNIQSAAAAATGCAFVTDELSISLSGGEVFDIILNIQTAAGTIIRAGFIDSVSAAAAVDGAYILIQQVGGVDITAAGVSISNSVSSTTGTTYAMSTATWYRLRVSINSDATLVTFSIMDSTGAVLWTDTVNSNIPTGAGRETGSGIIATRTGGAANIVFVDYMRLWFRLMSR
jgi:hypothetical protein